MEFIQFAIEQWTLSLAFVLVVLMLLWNLFGYKIQGYMQVDCQQAVTIINNKKPTVLDIRSKKEIDSTGMIANSVNFSVASLSNTQTKDIGKTDKPIIAVCKSGNRAAMACSNLKKKGFSEIYILKGGISDWIKQGLPVSQINEKKTKSSKTVKKNKNTKKTKNS